MNNFPGVAMERVLKALGDKGLDYRRAGGGYEAQCGNPAHPDDKPSMSVKQGNLGAVIHCHVCGEEGKPDILAGLGLTKADLFDQQLQRPDRPQVVATYIYEDADGAEQYRRDRREPGKDGKSKDFMQYRMVNGRKEYGLKDVVRVPWRLPQVIAAVKDGREIFWNEGEKCVQALEKIGQVGTTAGGAQDWRPGMAEWFDGAAKVTVIADNDEPGIKHARKVAAALKGRVREIRIVRGAVDRAKADIVDHIAAGHTLDELVDITDPRSHLRSVPPPADAPTEGSAALQPEETEPAAPQVGFDLTTVFGLRGCKVPRGYRITAKGVDHTTGKDDPPWARFTYAPLVVTSAYEDPDGEQSVQLSWTDRGKTVSRIVGRDIAKRGRELVKTLGSAGLPAIEGDARILERWIAEFEAANPGGIPHEKLARNLGWQPDGTFVSSPDSGTKLEVRYDEQRVPSQAFGVAGSAEEWRQAIALLERHKVPRIVIAASLAAPLLRPLGLPSFTVDISSRSTKGKTTALQCGCSVWANPSENAAAISNWRGTAFAIEKRFNLVRGLPTFLDETMAVSDEGIIDYVLYQLPMNQGKDRSGGYAGALPWETVLLSSGERTALSYTRNQGAAARTLCTTEAPFGDDGDTAREVHDAVFANYGHAGPRFAELVRKGLARDGGRDRLRQRHKDLTVLFRGDNAMTGRRAPMVAVLALAEAMACETGILPYEPLSTETWAETFTSSNATDNQPEMAMDVVREYIAAHSFELWPSRDPEDRPPLRGWLGAVKVSKEGTFIALMPERLRTILSDAGYSLDAVLDGWANAGYLSSAVDRGKVTYRIVTRFDGRTARCFQFTPEALTLNEDAREAA
ncbi:DUF927 domain-containing protein [Streptomyces caniscabiei]|uniref:DUF927 domain-containing protein n=1 Tax=Streptomyces caniscabiei TaxID=2746961 RepID=UPI0018733ACE|nr:DUF927 domain-containing protein [Streptomyces caniscabiei]MBE4790887.1 DUF927 domain-containing protein [Streptomyces caniscabiei]MDX2953314.1 DUF927 domain-containing protein [Streptomyces caniscabiei]MDX2987349.1 DUF927 domain-containing protein [Streptomyces caniscabiei]MDX3009514.1 DUF927 domain-containing protein [Streptomyces caniscabiei]